MTRVAVVGSGISGLTAAFRLRRALGPAATIDLYESTDRIGGVLRTELLSGRPHDVGAEAFIVRRPEAVALIDELGLADRVVSPTARRPALWSAGGLHPLPTPTLMGIPATADAMRGLADPADMALIDEECHREWQWQPGADVAIGDLVTERFGRSVLTRSVDPLLGGVYSSRADDIGLREALPALASQLDAGAASLSAAVGTLLANPTKSGPVFGALIGGYQTLIQALLEAAAPAVRLGTAVTAVQSTVSAQHRDSSETGWTLVDTDGGAREYDGVVLAVPAWVAGGLLDAVAPDAAVSLRAVQGASSVVVSLAFTPGTELPEHSGVLVAADAQVSTSRSGLHAKAFTFSSQKWSHLPEAGRAVLVRASFGRFGAEVAGPDVDGGVDARLVDEALSDLTTVCAAADIRAPGSALIASHVQHWPAAIPVYRPGHVAAMPAQHQLPRGMALAGSAYAGVGVPACIGQAGRAVQKVLGDLEP